MPDFAVQDLIACYRRGVFPMADARDDQRIFLVDPEQRGVIPLTDFHIPKRLARTIRQDVFEVRVDHDFDGVIDGCAAARPGRTTTWINDKIRYLYGELFRTGHCHTIETWSGGRLVGGLYGVALGGAFFGESMFSIQADASKVALAHLCARLVHGGFSLLDCQFVTEHLRQFGTVEIGRAEFHRQLEDAVVRRAEFGRLAKNARGVEVMAVLSGDDDAGHGRAARQI